jgi:hypothetical protein
MNRGNIVIAPLGDSDDAIDFDKYFDSDCGELLVGGIYGASFFGVVDGLSFPAALTAGQSSQHQQAGIIWVIFY